MYDPHNVSIKLGTRPYWPICQLFVDVESLVNSQGEILNDIGILGGLDCWFVGLVLCFGRWTMLDNYPSSPGRFV